MSEAFSRSIIDSRRLLYFYHVAKNGSLSRAEAALGAPQPVISRQLAKLEDEVGLQLLERNGRGVTLTRFGEVLFRHAETILEGMAQATEELDDARRNPTGQVRLAGPATFMSLYMPEVLRRFMEELPDVEVVALQVLTGEVYEKMVADKVDIGIVLSVPNKAKFEVHELLVEPMMCIVRRDHPLAGNTSISRTALAQHRLVVPSSAQGLRNIINSYMERATVFVPHLQVDSIPLIRELVAQGNLATILPQSTAALEFDNDRFSTIRLTPTLKRSLFAAHRKDVRNKGHVETMVRHISDVVRERTAELEAAA